MTATFRILSGGRTGAVHTSAEEFVVGRSLEAGLRLDPERDLEVSGRHARFRPRPDGWTVEDLGSRNGTFVNGRPVTAEARLREGDRIQFGRDGPEVEFRLGAAAPGPATVRVKAAVRRERTRAAVVGSALLGIIVLLGGSLVVVNARSRTSYDQERARLEERIDSLIDESRRTEASLASEVAGLGVALQESEVRLRRLREELDAAGENPSADGEQLRRDLLAAQSALRRQQLAASLDFRLVQRRARGAVAMLWVEHTNGERVTGTAFAVRKDGVLLTNRHIVKGADGSRTPARMAVRFSDSDQAFPARLLAVSREWDLAIIKVDNVLGDVPVVPGFNLRPDTVAPGAPIALIGYPLGGEPERDPILSARVARPIVSAGLLVHTSDDAVEVQGLGAEGGSGSPILDSAGYVIAVLYGGRIADGVQLLIGTPALAAVQFLEAMR